MTAQTYYLVIPTLNSKTVISGTLEGFNRCLGTNFTSMEALANAIQTDVDYQQAFYIDEYAIGLITVSKDPVLSEHQLSVADLLDDNL